MLRNRETGLSLPPMLEAALRLPYGKWLLAGDGIKILHQA